MYVRTYSCVSGSDNFVFHSTSSLTFGLLLDALCVYVSFFMAYDADICLKKYIFMVLERIFCVHKYYFSRLTLLLGKLNNIFSLSVVKVFMCLIYHRYYMECVNNMTYTIYMQ